MHSSQAINRSLFYTNPFFLGVTRLGRLFSTICCYVDDLCGDVLSVEEIWELDQIVSDFDREIKERGTEEEVDLREVLKNWSFEEDLRKPPETFTFLSFRSALLASLQTKHICLHIAKTLFDAMLAPDCIDAAEFFVKILSNRLHNCIRKAQETFLLKSFRVPQK